MPSHTKSERAKGNNRVGRKVKKLRGEGVPQNVAVARAVKRLSRKRRK